MPNVKTNSDCHLLIPLQDEPLPELSIVIPALNEELTIASFLAWCFEGIKEANIPTEILIIDSSEDKTAEIALAAGARVLKVPRRGLGRAYIDSIPYIRGKYVLMGDSDCTYDFREISPFVEKFRQGFEFIMGSRFRGTMEKGAMPPLHQYFGIPVTTLIYNMIYDQRFSDIHCGMRGITTDALKRMNLQSQSWEYASEMVVKWSLLRLRVAETPIKFYKDRDGRLSHHKRLGFLSPWLAGWINLKIMLIYGADFFLLRPGILVFLLGLLVAVYSFIDQQSSTNQPLSISLLFVGALLVTMGLSSFYSGIVARVLYDLCNQDTNHWLDLFAYNRSIYFSIIIFILASCALAAGVWLETVNQQTGIYFKTIPFVLAGLLFYWSCLNFTSMLVMHAILNLKALKANIKD